MKSLVILAGGKSSRMGQDKVLLHYDGKTLIERIYGNALVNFERIIISTDSEEHAAKIRSLPLFEGKTPEIVIDGYDAVGPMGGIRSVFEKSGVSRFAIISVDVPLADMDVLSALYDLCEKKAVYLKIGDKKPEPLIAAYDESAYEDIRTSLDAGRFKMRQVIPQDDVDIITDTELKKLFPGLKDCDMADAFRNFNTPEEFKTIDRPLNTTGNI